MTGKPCHRVVFAPTPIRMHGFGGWELVDFVRYQDEKGRDIGDASYEHPDGSTADVRVLFGRASEDSQLPRGPW